MKKGAAKATPFPTHQSRYNTSDAQQPLDLFHSAALSPEDSPRGNPEDLGCFVHTQAPLLHFLEDPGISPLRQLAHVPARVVVLALRKGTFQTLGGYFAISLGRYSPSTPLSQGETCPC